MMVAGKLWTPKCFPFIKNPVSIRSTSGDRRAQPSGGSCCTVQYTGWLPLPPHCDYSNRDDVDIFVKRATPTSTRSASSPMPDPPNQTSNVYRDQLSALSYGIALWDPRPPKNFYDKVSIGDVGYLHDGTFIRLFNVMLPWDDPSNQTVGNTEPYEPLNCGPFANTLQRKVERLEHYSRSVSADMNADNVQARRPDE